MGAALQNGVHAGERAAAVARGAYIATEQKHGEGRHIAPRCPRPPGPRRPPQCTPASHECPVQAGWRWGQRALRDPLFRHAFRDSRAHVARVRDQRLWILALQLLGYFCSPCCQRLAEAGRLAHGLQPGSRQDGRALAQHPLTACVNARWGAHRLWASTQRSGSWNAAPAAGRGNAPRADSAGHTVGTRRLVSWDASPLACDCPRHAGHPPVVLLQIHTSHPRKTHPVAWHPCYDDGSAGGGGGRCGRRHRGPDVRQPPCKGGLQCHTARHGQESPG